MNRKIQKTVRKNGRQAKYAHVCFRAGVLTSAEGSAKKGYRYDYNHSAQRTDA